MKFTVVGASGFIGGALVATLRKLGHEVNAPVRGAASLLHEPLGHVICAAGITADFRTRPFDALRANTALVAELLERAAFDSLLYLSSARIYRHAEHTREDARIFLTPEDPEDLYDFTKLTAEALCHASGRSNVRVVRLSNVVGADFRSGKFLFELIRAACDDGAIALQSALDSAKDYVWIGDVVEQVPKIALSGRHHCYNLCSGTNLTHRQLLEQIQTVTGARLSVRENAPCTVAAPIDIDRLREEFGYRPTPVLPLIPPLIDDYRKQRHAEN